MGAVRDLLNQRSRNRERLQKEAPNLYESFDDLVKRTYQSGALDLKEKELMGVACSIATRSLPNLANHASNARPTTACTK